MYCINLAICISSVFGRELLYSTESLTFAIISSIDGDTGIVYPPVAIDTGVVSSKSYRATIGLIPKD